MIETPIVGRIYKAEKATPPITAELLELTIVSARLKNAEGIEVTITLDQFKDQWTEAVPATYRYFVAYVTGSGDIGRSGISRTKPISSLNEIKEIEQYLTNELLKTSKAESADDASATVTAWQPFEVEPGLIEIAIRASQLLAHVLDSNPTEPWFTAEFKKAAKDVVGEDGP